MSEQVVVRVGEDPTADEQDELSEGVGQRNRQYKTIATHGAEVAVEARKVAKSLGQDGYRERKVLQIPPTMPNGCCYFSSPQMEVTHPGRYIEKRSPRAFDWWPGDAISFVHDASATVT